MIHQAHYVSYINIFKNMFKIHREIGPPVDQTNKDRTQSLRMYVAMNGIIFKI